MRKFAIGIVSLAAVLGVFVLYSRMDKTPPINTRPGRFSGSPADSNSSESENNIGDISTPTGKIGIGRTEKFEYITRNPETGKIENKYGFQRLLHTEGDFWEVDQPYMNIYNADVICEMKADHGLVQAEKIGGDTIPKDATFSGNVVINILPGKSKKIEESTIYLDTLAFISEKSQLSTAGDLRFDSNTVKLTGTGMELIYNGDLDRLEYFRVIDVNELKVKIRRSTLGTINQTSPVSGEEENSFTQPAAPNDIQKTKQPENENYTCLFSKNVLINTPDERIFAADEIEINDIIWSKDVNDKNTIEEFMSESEPNDPNYISDPNYINYPNHITDPNHFERPNIPYYITEEPNQPEDQQDDLIDVVITCDNGFIVAPKDSRKLNDFKDSAQSLPEIEKPEFTDETKKTSLFTEKIKLTTLEGNSIATGPTKLTFIVEDPNIPDPNFQSFPVTITSRSGAKFLKASNMVVFEDDCVCSIPQKYLNDQSTATLSSSMLTINIPEGKTDQLQSLKDIIALGPAELKFYVEDSNAAYEAHKIIPVSIKSKEKVLYLPAMNQVIFDKDCLCEVGSEETGKEKYFSLRTPNLKIGLPKESSAQSFEFSDINAAGPVALKFFMKDPNNMGTPQALLPVNITARKQAYYKSSTRQIVLDGSCRSSMLRQDTDYKQELTLLSDSITVDLPEDTNDDSPASTLTGIRHLKANGKQVKLIVTKKAKPGVIPNQSPDQVLGGSELICKSLDYDTQEQVFVTTGPGRLRLSDTEIKDSNDQDKNQMIGKKWWAETEDFNDLKYLLNDNRIIADAEPNKTINVQYIELENDNYSPVLMAAAGHVEIQLTENEEGKLEPSTVVASGGIDYRKDENNRCLGSVLIYDHRKSTITIHGDEKNPVYYNGSLADEIFIDLANDKIRVTSTSPSSL